MKDLIEFLQQPAPEFPTLQFRFAKTMAETPHAYVVRTRANEGEYVKLFGLITEHGVWEVWRKNGRRYQYYYRDGWKYWRMTNDLAQEQDYQPGQGVKRWLRRTTPPSTCPPCHDPPRPSKRAKLARGNAHGGCPTAGIGPALTHCVKSQRKRSRL